MQYSYVVHQIQNQIHDNIHIITENPKHRMLKKYRVKLLKYIFSQTNKCLQINQLHNR